MISRHYSVLITFSMAILFGMYSGVSFVSVYADVPENPSDLKANVVSPTQIDLFWTASDDDSIIGYKIEYRMNTDANYSTVIENTGNTDTIYSNTELSPDSVYAYRVYAINSSGNSESSSSVTVKTPSVNNNLNTDGPVSDIPTDVLANAISQTSVEISWKGPTQTYGQNVQGYIIKQEIASGLYTEIADVSASNTKYTLSNLSMGKTYKFVVVAKYTLGFSDVSKSVTVTLSSSSNNNNSDIIPDDVPDRPTSLDVKPISSSRIDLSWTAPDNGDDNNAAITGYKIEMRTLTDTTYKTLVTDTKSTDTKYSHTGLESDTDYFYRVYAINSEGTSNPSIEESTKTLDSSNEIQQNTSSSSNTIQQNDVLKLNSFDNFTIEQGEILLFQATLSTPSDISDNSLTFSLNNHLLV